MKYGYIIVEGYHDAEVIGHILRRENLISITKLEELDQYWKFLVPRNFPIDGDLMKRVPVPLFFQNNEYSIAVQIAGGDLKEIRKRLKATLENRDTLLEDVVGIGITVDADYGNDGAIGKFNQLKKELNSLIKLPENPGQVLKAKPKTGVFIFPDNRNKGTIENILLKCGQKVYSSILNGATNFVGSVNLKLLNKNDKLDFKKMSGRDKAKIGCVANILRPGRAVQVSIHDNDWISDPTIIIPEVAALKRLLEELFELS
jgi:hypothetical protein